LIKRFITLIALSLCSLKISAEEINIYTYHDKPPFVVDKSNQQGLFFDLATYLSFKLPQHSFKTLYIPRRRLDHLIENDTLDGIVVGVSPIWFKDKTEQNFLWLDPIMEDQDDFISLASRPFEYRDKSSLTDKTIIAVAGYYYFGVNEMVQKGEMLRIDTIGEQQVIELLAKQRADFGIVSQSVFMYLARHKLIEPSLFYLSNKPHDSFKRRAFVSRNDTELYKQLKPVFANIANDDDWHKFRNKYR
jgi:polar amino acid transport system substrate-binding protein